LGGYKGYSYATVVNVLSAALQTGNYLRMLTGIGQSGEKAPDALRIFTAGEKELDSLAGAKRQWCANK